MEEILFIEIGSLIKKARKLKGLTQEELSKAIDLSRASIANIERGNQKISIYTLYQIAEVLKVSPQSLLPEPEVLKKPQTDLYVNIDTLRNQLSNEEIEWVNKITKKTEMKEGMVNADDKED
ncbi:MULTISPECIES: helix-turn-helix domain-containing protein [Bacillaceae]|uniref:helix-turn-helix domain-containing protein n=1 Tax=Bacillaceae TaxID=186817 RepID=UPI0006935488|nr:helix-turn-helix transcriptional regulator [Bacillus rubiinfantis]